MQFINPKISYNIYSGQAHTKTPLYYYSRHAMQGTQGIQGIQENCDLKDLNSINKNKEKWSVLPPPWRNDIDGSADLVEEIIRIFGYENIPEAKLFSKDVIPKPAITRENKRLFSVKSLLAGRGMMECITYSFISFDKAKLFSIDEIDQLIISNPSKKTMARIMKDKINKGNQKR